MRPGGGKRKGGKFERKVCNQLSRMILPDSDETLFWRSAMSGGRSTNRFNKGKKDATQAGDITSIHPAGAWLTDKFFIECKNVRNLMIQFSLLEGKGTLAKFWRVAVTEAAKHKKYPMLIAKENRSRIILVLTQSGYEALSERQDLPEELVNSSTLDALIVDYEKIL